MKRYSILFTLIPFVLTACHGPEANEKSVPQKADTPEVKLLTLKDTLVSQKLTVSGELIPLDRANLYAKTSGYVRDVRADIGSRVGKGQIICVLDAPELRAGQAQALSNSSAAQAKYQSSRTTYMRLLQAARTPGAVADNELDLARNQMKTDSAAYQAALSAAHANAAIADYLTIRAPFSGVVTARNIFKGDYVDNAGKTLLFTVEDNSVLRIDVTVPEAYSSTALSDNTASFTVAANPGQVYNARLARKSEAIDPQVRGEIWEFTLPSAGTGLKPGMFAQVNLPVNRPHPGIMVPYKAVVTTQERKFVIRVENGIAHWVDVRAGFAIGDRTEIAGNLKPGDQLISSPNEEIKDGQPVKVKR
jgi:membrane fusion protein, multidrug efflux system